MSMLLDDVRREIVELHAFFVGWFSGTVARQELQPRFLARIDPDVIFIAPEDRIVGADDLSAGLHKGFATNSEFKIQNRDVALRREFGDTVLATYTEWQIGATTSAQASNARVTTVLMKKGPPLPLVAYPENMASRENMGRRSVRLLSWGQGTPHAGRDQLIKREER